MKQTQQILSQLPGDILSRLRNTDKLWQALRENTTPIPTGVKESQDTLGSTDWDVVICGGTLGIMMGVALQKRGWRVALIERGILRGREQEWNISRQELAVLLELELLSEAELAIAIASEYNPGRVSFFEGSDFWIRDVLNMGIDPVFLLNALKIKFMEAGGKLLENTAFGCAIIHPDGVQLEANHQNPFTSQPSSITLTTRLLIDAMGHFSPIVQQARQGQKPEGVCLVVGSCAQGFPQNETGDLIVSFTPIQNQCQYFWEAFPARDGRTTYLFTYLDAHPQRPSLEFLLDEYFRLLPEYQNIELSQLDFKRVLFGFFPSYKQSPTRMPWDRILPIGDSSGTQSPVSFGGFGAMVRHLKRLTEGIDEALKGDFLGQDAIAQLQPYQPNIAVTWMFQRAMSVGIDQKLNPNQINQLLTGVFQSMAQLGDDVLRPFLQDVVQFSGLSKTLLLTSVTKPGVVIPVIPHVGLTTLLNWMVHYINLSLYSSLYPLGKMMMKPVKRLPPITQYYYHRWLDAWHYGSGGDY
ncbi:MAG TPA: FAD-dependent oxidoreductase [Cyanobacteria bacterium UBA11149]|nr:FAD-dependent oxidoreductase [Cyanobacteria bacterium UBA11367]HBE56963.1 FAD-dependent oxidoreductase [Cyanobacteria bacterium UBA11366]HBK65194.1 FAD-dependent oxidoreductase [Cyanobacteria bacterium UBA11166]HBR74694.1 FAD-dependent oxidoreductase [Cyanobacteria bacterium UBA11159]HBS71792.1 FAD-dependent oxidoreductase [Cyanobacteria bacterium UBA11153]HBW91202.1 FAD-dependent oxidoreductase [Cyanobacteria bacterium UBA11149]HCA97551.1 FAD-dependent oxidoreductase [Cyanobacteria bacter